MKSIMFKIACITVLSLNGALFAAQKAGNGKPCFTEQQAEELASQAKTGLFKFVPDLTVDQKKNITNQLLSVYKTAQTFEQASHGVLQVQMSLMNSHEVDFDAMAEATLAYQDKAIESFMNRLKQEENSLELSNATWNELQKQIDPCFRASTSGLMAVENVKPFVEKFLQDAHVQNDVNKIKRFCTDVPAVELVAMQEKLRKYYALSQADKAKAQETPESIKRLYMMKYDQTVKQLKVVAQFFLENNKSLPAMFRESVIQHVMAVRQQVKTPEEAKIEGQKVIDTMLAEYNAQNKKVDKDKPAPQVVAQQPAMSAKAQKQARAQALEQQQAKAKAEALQRKEANKARDARLKMQADAKRQQKAAERAQAAAQAELERQREEAAQKEEADKKAQKKADKAARKAAQAAQQTQQEEQSPAAVDGADAQQVNDDEAAELAAQAKAAKDAQHAAQRNKAIHKRLQKGERAQRKLAEMYDQLQQTQQDSTASAAQLAAEKAEREKEQAAREQLDKKIKELQAKLEASKAQVMALSQQAVASNKALQEREKIQTRLQAEQLKLYQELEPLNAQWQAMQEQRQSDRAYIRRLRRHKKALKSANVRLQEEVQNLGAIAEDHAANLAAQQPIVQPQAPVLVVYQANGVPTYVVPPVNALMAPTSK